MAVKATAPVAASWPWSEDLNALDSLSLAPLNAQQIQQTQQRAKNMRIATTVPMMDPTPDPRPPELVGLYVCFWGSANSKLKESTSLQKASFISFSDASFGSIEARRLLLSVSFGAIERVVLSAARVATSVPFTVVSPIIAAAESVLLFSAILSRVLLTASRMTGDGLVS